MRKDLPKPDEGAVFYEDQKLYATLASYPITRGHVVIVWKKKVSDLHLLKRRDYEYLMDKVDWVRDAMLKILKIKKVYLMYMDEVNHVHWHLVPRYDKTGINVLEERPKRLKDVSLARKLERNLWRR
ncbi:HIT family protein [Candidatus Woesearchaeota archaeon]|nr:HIT family protein [Candidatus Woesearchaeota archaeon]